MIYGCPQKIEQNQEKSKQSVGINGNCACIKPRIHPIYQWRVVSPISQPTSSRGGYTDDQMIAGTARHTGWDYIDKKLPHYVCVSTSRTLKAVETWLPMQSLILKASLENLPIKWQEGSQPLLLLWKLRRGRPVSPAVSLGPNTSLLAKYCISMAIREKLNRKPSIFSLNMGLSCRFSLKPIHW